MDVDASRRDECVSPDLMEQLVACVDPSGVLREKGEELHLDRRQIYFPACHNHFIFVEIDQEILVGKLPFLGIPAALPGRPSESGPDPSGQFSHAERLDHVVVGAYFQAEHAVHLGVLGAQYDNSHAGVVRVGPDLSAHLKPLNAGKHDGVYYGSKAPGEVIPGKVTILPSASPVDGPILSAGGSLSVIAGSLPVGVGQSLQPGGGIEQDGYLAAPMGSISLQAATAGARVYLADGSVTTTAGSDAPVVYGIIQLATDSQTLGDNIWAIPDKANPGATIPFTQVTGAPTKSVSMTASKGDVIVSSGAVVAVSGGGSVLASRFVPSYSGSNNPLSGSYVILPYNSAVLPGNGVYLAGMNGLPAGVYSLLPAVDANGNATSYAFMPGALIVTNLGAAASINANALTPDGYPILSGYTVTMGTAIRSVQPDNYEVRPASVVLAEGDFETQSITAGAAGGVTITGNTTILNGTVQAGALPGYSGGSIALSGQKIAVQSSIVALPTDFGFSTPVPSDLAGTLNIASAVWVGLVFTSTDFSAADDALNTQGLNSPNGAVVSLDNIGTPSAVPIPCALMLLGGGLASIALIDLALRLRLARPRRARPD